MNHEDHHEAAKNGRYCPEIPCRWSSYWVYRLLVLIFMMSEPSSVHAITQMSHGPFCSMAALQIFVVIFVGIPLVYSEICIAQYTNCSLISLWNYFPVFRGLGHIMAFTIILRTILLNVLNSWYLIYVFHGALNPPPWFTCDYFNATTKCMIKRVNVSIFQHCIEAQLLFDEDCSVSTASSIFFTIEIGSNNTQDNPSACFYPWKPLLATLCINLTIFLLSIKNERFLQLLVKIVTAIIILATFVLSCVALSMSGSWSWLKDDSLWPNVTALRIVISMTNSFLSLGTGTGMVAFLSRDAGFRCPATMTAVTTTLLANTICLTLSLIIYCGVKIMSYFHSSQYFVIEVGESTVFEELSSVAEILSYFNSQPFWGFLWFFIIFAGLFMNMWLSYEFLHDLLHKNTLLGKKYKKLFRLITQIVIVIFALPFYCCDLFESLVDMVELMQLVTTLLFSISLYWFYGFNRHADDITFMIGVKASIYWRTAWVVNPIFIIVFIIGKYHVLEDQDERAPSRKLFLGSLEVESKFVCIYIIAAAYVIIFIGGTIFELVTYNNFDGIRSLFEPTSNWGPKDTILYKSRKMFVPQIMTTEFLYRQVRIRGYKQKAKRKQSKLPEVLSNENYTEWSVLTSN